VRRTIEAFTEVKILNAVTVARDGVELRAILRGADRTGTLRASWRPDLLLLDLSLPTEVRREVLAELQADPELRTTPVVILTASHEEQDLLGGHSITKAGYLTKPVDGMSLLGLVREIDALGLCVVTTDCC
jgi:CheY-like chemotaxis protein